jgi:hypothetical protein
VRRIGESVIHQSSTTKWRVSPSADPFYALNQQRTSSFATGAKAEISGLFTAYNTENILAFAEIRDMSLARSEDSPQRFYGMSAQIRIERKEYYDVLENTQKGELNITPWLEWFLGCLDRAFDGAETILAAVLKKADFWKKHAAARINDRQRDILNHLLDGFEGRLTSSKWALIEKCSPDTALRDISELIELAFFKRTEQADAAPATRWPDTLACRLERNVLVGLVGAVAPYLPIVITRACG